MKKSCILYFFIIFALAACGDRKDSRKNGAEKAAVSFAKYYFNYDFGRAAKHVTESSVRYLQFAASNITQEDVDILRSMDESATVEVDSSVVNADGEVFITVRNFMMKDTIGNKGRVVAEEHFRLCLVNDGNWKVDLRGLPQRLKDRKRH